MKKPGVVSVTASTGMAASNIGGTFFTFGWYIHSKPFMAPAATYRSDSAAPRSAGMTIHSWGAVTLGQKDLDKQIRCIRTCKPALNRWRKTEVLIIDEGEYLDSRSPLGDVGVNRT